jgi:hypothetical protein
LLQEKSLLDGKKAQNDVRFSQKGSNVLAEVNRLQQVNASLKEQFKRTKFASVDKKSLDRFAKTLLKYYSSGADINETREALDDLYRYMANGDGKNQPVWEEVLDRARKVAESVLEGAVVVDDSKYQEYKDLRDYLRTTGMTIDPVRMRQAEIAPLARDALIRCGLASVVFRMGERDIDPDYEKEGY